MRRPKSGPGGARAIRRTAGPASVAEVATALTERDAATAPATASPLYAAADAVLVDTTGKSVAEVVREVMEVVQSRLAATA